MTSGLGFEPLCDETSPMPPGKSIGLRRRHEVETRLTVLTISSCDMERMRSAMLSGSWSLQSMKQDGGIVSARYLPPPQYSGTHPARNAWPIFSVM